MDAASNAAGAADLVERVEALERDLVDLRARLEQVADWLADVAAGCS